MKFFKRFNRGPAKPEKPEPQQKPEPRQEPEPQPEVEDKKEGVESWYAQLDGLDKDDFVTREGESDAEVILDIMKKLPASDAKDQEKTAIKTRIVAYMKEVAESSVRDLTDEQKKAGVQEYFSSLDKEAVDHLSAETPDEDVIATIEFVEDKLQEAADDAPDV
ncbi:MAG: hypothetical protein CMI52_03105 [Parcubacteria group bacterium]|nr:hypothetical protein [Parcubacteria group bacterium]|tara:strand:+ start:1070 stop:1558 length:489 start_codon:yes stop_codon:yes gene_type:complete